MAAPRRPAGRSGHVTRPGPRRPPSLADALARPGGGPGVMITRAGTRSFPRPRSQAAQPEERGPVPGGGRGLFFPTRGRPAPARGPGTGLRGSAARGPPPSPLPALSTAAAGPASPTPLRSAHRTGSVPESRDLARTLPRAPGTGQKMTLSARKRQLRGGHPHEPGSPPPPPCE